MRRWTPSLTTPRLHALDCQVTPVPPQPQAAERTGAGAAAAAEAETEAGQALHQQVKEEGSGGSSARIFRKVATPVTTPAEQIETPAKGLYSLFHSPPSSFPASSCETTNFVGEA